MKKMMTNMKTLVALLMAGAAVTSCSSDNEMDSPKAPAAKTYTMTVQATKGGDAMTRALADGGTTLTATWSVDDVVEVWSEDGTTTKYGELTAATAGASTTLTGTLTTAPTDQETLTLKYLSPSYATQDGTLTGTDNSIDKKCDYATATVTATVDGDNVTTTAAAFEHQQAIVRFTLKNSDGTALPSNPTAFTMTDGTSTVELTNIPAGTYTTNGEGVLYVALPAVSSKTVTLTATVGSDTYILTTSSAKSFANGSYYRVTAKMAKVVAYSSEIIVPAGDHWYIGGSSEYNNITIGNGATVTIGSFLQVQNASIICSGNATIILADETFTNITGGRIQAGPEGTTLTIKGNTGELNINPGTSSGAAIGASDDACGNIVIEGGIITATGAQDAGIGASNAKCGNITISGGTVTVTGSNGAGIGASNAECGDITISGGTDTATGGTMAAGIGGGSSDNGWCGNITISGGTVTATGGFMSAGIGTGSENGCGDITITSGVTHVTATKGSGASASIGAANDGDAQCGEVNIEDESKVTQN